MEGRTPDEIGSTKKWYEPLLKNMEEEIRNNVQTGNILKLKRDDIAKTIQEKTGATQNISVQFGEYQNKLIEVTGGKEHFLARIGSTYDTIEALKNKSEFLFETLEDFSGRFQVASELFEEMWKGTMEEFALSDKYSDYFKKQKGFLTVFAEEHNKMTESANDEMNSTIYFILTETKAFERENEDEAMIEQIDAKIGLIDSDSTALLDNATGIEKIQSIFNQLKDVEIQRQDENSHLELMCSTLETQLESTENEPIKIQTRITEQNECIQAVKDDGKENEIRFERECTEYDHLLKVLEEAQASKNVADESELRGQISNLPSNLDDELVQIDKRIEVLRDSGCDLQDRLDSWTSQVEEFDTEKHLLETAHSEVDDQLKRTVEEDQKDSGSWEIEREIVENVERELIDLKAKVDQITLEMESNDLYIDGNVSKLDELVETFNETLAELKREEENIEVLQNKIDSAKQTCLLDEVSPQVLDELRSQLEQFIERQSSVSDMMFKQIEEYTAAAEKSALIDQKQEMLQRDRDQLVQQKQEAHFEGQRQFEEMKQAAEKKLEDLKTKCKKIDDEAEQVKSVNCHNLMLAIKTIRKVSDATFEAGMTFKNYSSDFLQLIPVVIKELETAKNVENLSKEPTSTMPAVNLFDSTCESSEELVVNKPKVVRSYQSRAPKILADKPDPRPESPTSTVKSEDDNDIDMLFKPRTSYVGPGRSVKASKPKAVSSADSSIELSVPWKTLKSVSRKDIFLGGANKIDSRNIGFGSSLQNEDQPPFKRFAKDPYAFDSQSSEDVRPTPNRMIHSTAPRFNVENKPNDNGDSSDNLIQATPPPSTSGINKRKLLGRTDDAIFASQSDGESQNDASGVTRLSIKSNFNMSRKRKRLGTKKATAAKGSK